MFNYDERIRGLPAAREAVVALFQSINQPHLAVPGKQAGPAQAFVVGLRNANGFSVFVYLYLPEASDCAVYVSDQRNLSPEQYRDEEGEAIAFAESMGFMMDNMNFRGFKPEQQDEALKTLPVFLKDPRLAPQQPGGTQKPSAAAPPRPAEPNTPAPSAAPAVSAEGLAKLFTSF